LRRHGVRASRSEDAVVAIAPGDRERLLNLLADAPGATWGIAEGTVAIPDLRDAYIRARATAVAAVALGRRGTVSLEAELGPYLLLNVLKKDQASTLLLDDLLGPLLAYDRRTARDLMGTLEVYLAGNCNTS